MKPDFNKYKIIPAIIQNKKTKKILMPGWMNKESFDKTIETKKVWFFSRSKDRPWQKGESSENYLNVEQIKLIVIMTLFCRRSTFRVLFDRLY